MTSANLRYPVIKDFTQQYKALKGPPDGQVVSSPKNSKGGPLFGKVKQLMHTKKGKKIKHWKCKSLGECKAYGIVLRCYTRDRQEDFQYADHHYTSIILDAIKP